MAALYTCERCRVTSTSVGIQSLPVTDTRHAIRNGLICALVVAACLWATRPLAEIGINDDWSYIKTAEVFAQTGHFAYNGWSAMILGWLVGWGALFIKLFGFSFTVVRLSMLPIAMATVFLFHAILLRFGVNPRNAVLGTLALGLSPLFIPLAVTYMSDVPGLFVIVLCLYLCQRAVAADSNMAAIAWLCMAAATNVLGGTVRQIAWLGALVMVPSAGWLLRKRGGVLLTASLLWVFSVVSIFACMHWYARQPYSVPQPILRGPAFNPSVPLYGYAFDLLGAALCLLLVVLPILVAWLPEARRLSRAALLRIGLTTLLWGIFQLITKWTMPWLLDVIDYEFIAARTDLMREPGSLFLPMWTREAISLLAIATALILVEQVWSKVWPLVRNKSIRVDSWREMLWLLGPFSLSYLILLVPVAYHTILFDRYVLLMMPVAILCMLKLHQQWIAPTLPAISVAVLGIFALFAIAGTHDWFAWSRARLAAIAEIRESGVPRTAIQGGFEYDGWTQIEEAGYVNNPKLVVPSGAYHLAARPDPLPADCRFKFAAETPAVHPKFTIVFPKMWCLAPSNYPPISYRTWLPPYRGTILVQEIPDGFSK